MFLMKTAEAFTRKEAAMREIKFRGKRLDDNRWIYGDLMRHQDGDTFIGDNTHYWTDDGYHNNEYEEVRAVEDDTVGQFTGLCDKNGKEIYEGDILGFYEDPDFLPETVIFSEGSFIVKDDYTTTAMSAIDTECRTIIGNIYDNPELLNQ